MAALHECGGEYESNDVRLLLHQVFIVAQYTLITSNTISNHIICETKLMLCWSAKLAGLAGTCVLRHIAIS